MSLQELQPLWLPPCAPTGPHLATGPLHGSEGCDLSLSPDHNIVFDGGCSVHCSGACVQGGTALAALFFCDAEVPEHLDVQYKVSVASGTAAALVLLFAEKDELTVTVLHPENWTEEMLEETQLHLLDQDVSCEMLPSKSRSCFPGSRTSADSVRAVHLYRSRVMCCLGRGIDLVAMQCH